MIEWTNLHCHSEYSLLDGMSRISEIVEYAKKHSGVACITDHRTLAGAGELDVECKKNEIKPIFGCEFNICKDINEHNNRGHHLCLYAMNRTGFNNLCKLVTISNKDGYYYVPRIDFNILKQYSDGVICSTACIGSPFAKYIKNGHSPKKELEKYALLFKDRFFVEFQDHHFEEERGIMYSLCLEAINLGLPIIATLDSHYTYETDKDIHKVLLSMNMKKPFIDVNGLSGDGYHLLNDSELLNRFPKDYLKTTMDLVKLVEGDVIDWGTDKSPKYR